MLCVRARQLVAQLLYLSLQLLLWLYDQSHSHPYLPYSAKLAKKLIHLHVQGNTEHNMLKLKD